MSSCCESSDSKKATKGAGLVIALAGNPNAGKTTIFNALTGLKQKVANYPGVTVEKKTGTCKLPAGQTATIIDLPGTYSLVSRSPDEVIAMQVLRGLRSDVPAVDAVIVVVDASNLQRNLYLVSQLIELGKPFVVALNMMDIAERRGLRISAERLSKQIGVPVIPIVGHKKKGINELKQAIAHARPAPMPEWALPMAMKEEIGLVAGALGIMTSRTEDSGLRTERSASDVRTQSSVLSTQSFQALAERLLISDHADDLSPIAKQEPVKSLLTSAHSRLSQLGIDPMHADIEAHYDWIDNVAAASLVPACENIGLLTPSPGTPDLGELSRGGEGRGEGEKPAVLDYAKKLTFSEKLDRILIHKVWGLLIFALIMGSLFVSIFWLAQPIMDALQNGVGWLGEKVVGHLPAGPIHDLVKDGIFKGVGAVLVFVPQIALLFMFLSILEDSGYLARAAFLMDRLLAKVGLHGKSFIPLLSSFACAIPGVLATRTIENRKERLATILVLPFMSCSARLPVYTLLIGTFFASFGALKQAGIMLALYALGIIAAAGTAFVFKRTLMKGPATTFILELPTYKLPQASQVARQVWINSKEFVTKAGTTIFCLSVILWGLMYYPRLPEAEVQRVRAENTPVASTIGMIKSIAAKADPQKQIRDLQVTENNLATLNSQFQTTMSPASMSPRGTVRVTGKLAGGDNPTHTENRPVEASKIGNDVRIVANGKEVTQAEVQKNAEPELEKAVAAAQLRHSFAGRFGHLIEPAIKPLGYDWKMGVGLVGAFAAREVFVSTMGIVYSVGEIEDATTPLSDAMRADHYADGRPVWTPVVAVSLLVWFVLAMQCMSTMAIVRRETGGWGWPMFMMVYMNALAYVVALGVYQVGVRFFS